MARNLMRSLAVIGLLVVAMFAMITPIVLADYTTKVLITKDNQLNYFLHVADDEILEVYYWPAESGNKQVTMSHSTWYYWDQSAATSWYYTYDRGKTWNHFNDAAVSYWPKTTATIFGSTNIGYKFVIRSWTPDYLMLNIKIT